MSTPNIYHDSWFTCLSQDENPWVMRAPTLRDGIKIHDLITSCPPLDKNSTYCNFLQASHFHKTCILAEDDDKIAGFISAYLKPDVNDELFIWQVAVSPTMRGKGLAGRMLKALLMREHLQLVQAVETTITKYNDGSWNLFNKLDKANGNSGSVSVFLDEQKHFKGHHDTEFLYRVPLKNNQ
ncbi:diaminobutyrate acetyltransferase [Candidatus Enterovibrio escicola]|uniref:L-2,4-diaminobutyric acid acetyltransferase n=1 Tax=Candidatus Enterovibrio escicola TaxID=1927127 RepID=A0A2A5T7Q3_9GAMM|nr:diaminobutyrate acetyltransferase [Candidatus Enterovibrio escacola]PCS24191.1 L-2,4-diaminobutyric acid acetyltransferase [Candidatus Enterovibrio escacola]